MVALFIGYSSPVFSAVSLNEKLASGQYVQKVDAFEVIFDATLSMNDMYKGGSKLNQEKALVNLFNDTIPNLKLTAAARAFGRLTTFGDETSKALFAPTSYSKSLLPQAIAPFTMGNGFSPLDAGLDGATADLQSQSGQLAVIAFSDGNDMQQYDPVGAAKRMKKAYGDRVCIYTVVIGDKAALIDLGDKAEGVKMMKKVADAGECGFSVIGESISTPAGMADFVEKVFLEAKRPEPPRPGPPPPAPVQEMKKAPLQSKTMVFEAAALFDFDKSDLKPEGKEQIKAYRDKVKEDMSRADKVKITGHTDNIGKPEYNMKLSLRRAETVRDYLISFGGIDPKKLEVIGKGENNPIAENSTEKGRAKNRRVEIEVIGLEK
jgi:OOP family OmpA-OmpF porin